VSSDMTDSCVRRRGPLGVDVPRAGQESEPRRPPTAHSGERRLNLHPFRPRVTPPPGPTATACPRTPAHPLTADQTNTQRRARTPPAGRRPPPSSPGCPRFVHNPAAQARTMARDQWPTSCRRATARPGCFRLEAVAPWRAGYGGERLNSSKSGTSVHAASARPV